MSLKRLQQQFESQVVGGKASSSEPQENFAPLATFNEPRPYVIVDGDSGPEACEVLSQTNISGYSPALWIRSDDDNSMAPVSISNKQGLEIFSNRAAAYQALQHRLRQTTSSSRS